MTALRAPPPNRLQYARIFRPNAHHLIDCGMVAFFRSPASFTGEDVAEFYTHASRAVCAAMLEAFASVDGCRQAERGEFATRAFIAGKMDIVAAEALADLLDAETEAQRVHALRGMTVINVHNFLFGTRIKLFSWQLHEAAFEEKF